MTTCHSKAVMLMKKKFETVPPFDEEELNDKIKVSRRSGIVIIALLMKGALSQVTKRLFEKLKISR